MLGGRLQTATCGTSGGCLAPRVSTRRVIQRAMYADPDSSHGSGSSSSSSEEEQEDAPAVVKRRGMPPPSVTHVPKYELDLVNPIYHKFAPDLLPRCFPAPPEDDGGPPGVGAAVPPGAGAAVPKPLPAALSAFPPPRLVESARNLKGFFNSNERASAGFADLHCRCPGGCDLASCKQQHRDAAVAAKVAAAGRKGQHMGHVKKKHQLTSMDMYGLVSSFKNDQSIAGVSMDSDIYSNGANKVNIVRARVRFTAPLCLVVVERPTVLAPRAHLPPPPTPSHITLDTVRTFFPVLCACAPPGAL